MSFTEPQKKALDEAITKLARLEDEKKMLADDIKELTAGTVDSFREHGVTAKVVKQLVKERGYDEIERMAQRQAEETLDQCRHALGLLADLPLGEHAQQRAVAKTSKRREKADAH